MSLLMPNLFQAEIYRLNKWQNICYPHRIKKLLPGNINDRPERPISIKNRSENDLPGPDI
jgi:hypothetical protein